MRARVLVAAEEPALRARLVRILQSCGHVPAFARGDRRGPLTTRKLSAALVAPASFDDKGLALARELCAGGCRVIVLARSREALAMVSRLLPDADVLAQPVDEQRLVRLLAEITQAQASEEAVPATVLRFEGRSLDLAGRALIDENGREIPLTHAEFELLALFARCSGRVLSRDQLRNGISSGTRAASRRGNAIIDRTAAQGGGPRTALGGASAAERTGVPDPRVGGHVGRARP